MLKLIEAEFPLSWWKWRLKAETGDETINAIVFFVPMSENTSVYNRCCQVENKQMRRREHPEAGTEG